MIERKMECEYFCGVDIARYGSDESVIVVIELAPLGIASLIYAEATSKKPVTDTVGRIMNLHMHFDFKKVFVDETGLGAGAVDMLKEKVIPIEPITFTLQEKDKMYRHMKMMLEQNRFKIKIYELKMLNQICSLQYECTSTGHYKLHHPDNGHDDWCFIAGTQILTNKGQISIEKLKEGDLVMTRQGFKRIIKTGNRIANVITRFGLTGTPEHPIITKEGLKPLSLLKESDITYIWNEKQSCIEEGSITDIPNQKEGNYECISGPIQSGNSHRRHYIDKSGKTISETYQKDTLSIIKMETQPIMTSTILKSCQEQNISQNIKQRKGERHQEEILKSMQDLKPQSGTGQKKEEHGIRNMRVYNISVEDANEYFANSILVHNCDAIALALRCTMTGPSGEFKSFSEETLKKWDEFMG